MFHYHQFFDTLASILIFTVLYCLFIQDEIKSQRDVILILSLQTLFGVIYYHSILSSISLRVALDAWTRIWFKLRLPIRVLFILLVFAATFTNFKVYFPLLCLTRAIHILAGNRNVSLESIERVVVGNASKLVLDQQKIEREVEADKTGHTNFDPSEHTYAVKDDTISAGTKMFSFLSNNQQSRNHDGGDLTILSSKPSTGTSLPQSHVISSEPMTVDRSRLRFDSNTSDGRKNTISSLPVSSKLVHDTTTTITTTTPTAAATSKEILRSNVPVVRPSAQPIPSHSAFATDVTTNAFPFNHTSLRVNNKRKSDFLSIEDGESSSKVVKSHTTEGRPTLKRKQSLLVRLGVAWGDEGHTIEFPETTAKKKSRIQPDLPIAPQQQPSPVPKVEEAIAPLLQHKVEQEAESTSILPAANSWKSTPAFNFDMFQSTSATSSSPTPSTGAASASLKSEPAGPFQPSSQPTSFASPPPAVAPSSTTFTDPVTLGKGGVALTKTVGGRPPLSPSTPSIVPSPGNDSTAGSEVVVGIAFKPWNAAAPETSSSSSGAANSNREDLSKAASSFPSLQPQGAFSSNGPAAAHGFMSSGSSGTSSALNPFSSSFAPPTVPAVGSFQFTATTAAASFNPAAAAAANPFSSTFAAATTAPVSVALAPSAGFFATGASSSSTSRRKVSVRGKR